MKAVLFAAAASLALAAGPAFASSENYEDGPARPIESGPAAVAAGSDAYFVFAANRDVTHSNTVIGDTGSDATPLFAGQPSITISGATVVGSNE